MTNTASHTKPLFLSLVVLGALLGGCTSESRQENGTGEDAVTAATPRTLFTGTSTPREIAADGDAVYFTDGPTKELRRVPLAGGEATVLWSGHGLDALGFVRVDAGVVYFTEDGRVLSVPAKGGEVKELARVRNDFPGMLATDADYVYWGGENEFDADYQAYVYRVKKTGGEIETVYKGYKGVSLFAVSNGYVYISGGDHEQIMNPPNRIMRIPVGGGTPVEIASVPRYVFAMTVDASRVYFSAVVDQKWTIETVATTGGVTNKLVEMAFIDQNQPDKLAVSDTTLFWTSPSTFDFSKDEADQHNAHVRSVDKVKGGEPKNEMLHIASPAGFALVGNCPVWAATTTVQTSCK